MKSNNLIYACLFLSIANFSCSKAPAEINFTEIVVEKDLLNKSRDKYYAIDFCSILEMEWDKVWIVPPYSNSFQLDSIKVENYYPIKSKLEQRSGVDWKIQLVVEHKSKIVAYGYLENAPLNLSKIKNVDGTMVSFTKTDCGGFYSEGTLDSVTDAIWVGFSKKK